jgi:hypothetical protein
MMAKNYFKIFTMMKKYYYVIRDSKTHKMVYSSKFYKLRSDAEKYAKKRTNLYNVQWNILKNNG